MMTTMTVFPTTSFTRLLRDGSDEGTRVLDPQDRGSRKRHGRWSNEGERDQDGRAWETKQAGQDEKNLTSKELEIIDVSKPFPIAVIRPRMTIRHTL